MITTVMITTTTLIDWCLTTLAVYQLYRGVANITCHSKKTSGKPCNQQI